MPEDYKAAVRRAVLEGSFLKATFSKRLREDDTPWIRLALRPVFVKGARAIQFSYFDGKRDVTKNASGPAAVRRLDKDEDVLPQLERINAA